MTDLQFATSLTKPLRAERVALLSPTKALEGGLAKKLFKGEWTKGLAAMIKDPPGGPMGGCVSTWTGSKPAKLALGFLPNEVSRHASPSRNHAVHSTCEGAGLGSSGDRTVALCLDDPAHYLAAANAIGVPDPAGNIKMDKSKSTQRIDPLVAAVMAAYPVSEGDTVEEFDAAAMIG